MSDSPWDAKFKGFLKKTGEDFKRFGRDVKQEAERLLVEVQDPARQQQVRESLKEVGTWARKTAEEVATLVETGVKQAEGALNRASAKAGDFVQAPGAPPAPEAPPPVAAAPLATPPSPPPQMEAAPPPRPRKTVGRAAGAKKKSPPAARRAPAKKSLGKKPPAE